MFYSRALLQKMVVDLADPDSVTLVTGIQLLLQSLTTEDGS